MSKEEISVDFCKSIKNISSTDWNNCAGNYNPFLKHEFLVALEESGCVRKENGWQPYHIIAKNKKSEVIGCAPMYLKYHSQGEYIFDYAWADAYQKAGGQYYPKLLVAVPFTPVPGERFLTKNHKNNELIKLKMIEKAIEILEQLNLSSFNINFLHKQDLLLAKKSNLLIRIGEQFHWKNNDYKCFDNFLSDLSSRKRKAIRKERLKSIETGINIEKIAGRDLKTEHWDAFYNFYVDTSNRKWGNAYLNREFFEIISKNMKNEILLIMAKKNDLWIAGALNFIGKECLFGRYWGCIQDHDSLHFEVCYYQAIDFAIENNFKTVEAGAQGLHKLNRGYLPVKTYSAHWVNNIYFREAIAKYLAIERNSIIREINIIDSHSPFKKEK